MIKKIIILAFLLSFSLIALPASGTSPENLELTTSSEVTLKNAIDLALENSPQLELARNEEEESTALVRQAGARPNPEFEVEVEELAWAGERDGFNTAELVFSLSQTIETAGKRGLRSRLANIEEQLSNWDYRGKRLDVIQDVTGTFIRVLAAQRKYALAEELHQLTSRVLEIVSERVKAGKVSPLEQAKARVESSTSLLKLEQAKRELEVARSILASLWGSPEPVFLKALGDLKAISSPPAYEQLLPLLAQNPDIARLSWEIKLADSELQSELAAQNSDLELSAGVQRSQETGDKAYIFGIGTELPVNDRNRGNITAAHLRTTRAETSRRMVELEIRTSLYELHRDFMLSYREITVLKKSVVPAAQHAFDAAREGYRQGKFEYLDVLDAQRTLFEAKDGYIEALAAYHKAKSGMERLIGQSLEPLTTGQSDEAKGAHQ